MAGVPSSAYARSSSDCSPISGDRIFSLGGKIEMDITRIRTLVARIKADATEIEQLAIGAVAPPSPPPVPPDLWRSFVATLAKHPAPPNEIKPAILAQAIIETGRGKSNLFVLHNNFAGMKWRDAMKGYCIPINVAVTSEPSGFGVFCKFATQSSAIDGWLKFIMRSPYSGWERFSQDPEKFLRFICHIWAADRDYLEKCLSVLSEASSLLLEAGWKPSKPTGKLIGRKILVDPGHSPSAQGASGKPGSSITEYAMNSLQAVIVTDMLRKEGADVELYDPDPDLLSAVGKRAKGKDVFLSLHHNAANADGIDEGTETYVPSGSNDVARKLALKVNQAIVAAISSKDRGVKEKDYTVIATALSVGCPICMLVESYFIDDYASLDVVAHRSKEAAKAIAKAIIEGL